jgi:hypothetical protein
MTEERRKVLELLAAGKISAADAERLLDKLADAAVETADSEANSGTRDSVASPKKPRFLRILVERADGQDRVNIRVPLAFARSGSRLLSVLPSQVTERLASQGIDIGLLTSLSREDLEQALRELNVDIEKGDGRKVRIFCE